MTRFNALNEMLLTIPHSVGLCLRRYGKVSRLLVCLVLLTRSFIPDSSLAAVVKIGKNAADADSTLVQASIATIPDLGAAPLPPGNPSGTPDLSPTFYASMAEALASTASQAVTPISTADTAKGSSLAASVISAPAPTYADGKLQDNASPTPRSANATVLLEKESLDQAAIGPDSINRLWARLLNWTSHDASSPVPTSTGSDRPSLRRWLRPVNPSTDTRKQDLRDVIAPYRGQIRLAAALKATHVGLTLLNAKLIGNLVQNALRQDVHATLISAALSLAVLAATIPLRHSGDVLQGTAGAGAINDLRQAVFAGVIEEPSFRSGGTAPGVLASRVKDGPTAIEQVAVRLPVRKWTALLTLGASSILLLSLHPAAAAVALGAAAAIKVVGVVCGRITRRLFNDYQQQGADLNARLVDVLENADIVAAYGAAPRETARLAHLLAGLRATLVAGAKIGARWRSFEEIFAIPLAFPGAFVVSLLIGLPVGSAITAALYASYAYGALGELVDIAALNNQHAGAIAEARRILSMVRTPQKEPSPALLSGVVRAEDVLFRYDARQHAALGPIRFTFPAQQITLVTGPSGSGKTTLLRLIAGLDRPSSGRLLIDGRDAYLLRSKQWRRQIGYVPQDAGLMEGTIGENLRYGKPDADDAELERALRSFAGDFILDKERFPQGLYTPVGPKGSGLSGGQAQIVALVRALLNRPRLLILDEPTSSLDAKTEEAILKVLRGLRNGRFGPPPTIIMVSHRAASAELADRIVRLTPNGLPQADGN